MRGDPDIASDEDSESRGSPVPSSAGKKQRVKNDHDTRLPRRFRGFSTSIRDVFLDDQIVCGAFACFGLLLSTRTEHLLNERHVGRRGQEGGRKTPSRILSFSLVVTILAMAATYAIWGFPDRPARHHWKKECKVLCKMQSSFTQASNSVKSSFHDLIDSFKDPSKCHENGYDLINGTVGCGYDEDGSLVYYDENGTVVYVDWEGMMYYDVDENSYVYEESSAPAYYDDVVANDNDDGNQVDDKANGYDDDNQNANAMYDDYNVDDANKNANAYYAYDDGYNGDDGAQQGQGADDANANYDDAYAYAYADDGAKANDDGAQQDEAHDDGNDDDGAYADDGAQQEAANGDDGAYADDGAQQEAGNDDGNGDDGAYADDGAQQDDNANRKLKAASNRRFPVSSKHSFVGIMKLRDHQVNVFEPTISMVLDAYTSFMVQFKDDELSETAQLDRQLYQQHQQQFGVNTLYETGSLVRYILWALFLAVLAFYGRRRRMKTRFAILRSRAQDDQNVLSSMNQKESARRSGHRALASFHEREDRYDGACSHNLIGCYPVDNEESRGTSDIGCCKGGDFMSLSMKAIFDCCCGKLCQCWCQVLSICAIAQEAREVRLLVPPKLQRIDLMTHQPFREYANDIHVLRRKFMDRATRNWDHHFNALSQLSVYILLAYMVIAVLLAFAVVLRPIGGFGWDDALVLIFTSIQSFGVMFVYYGFHKSSLSLDALIKYFAIGSFICLPVGIILQGLLTNGLISFMWVMCGGTQNGGTIDAIEIITEIVQAYLIASCVEELCKYYGFRFLEHPDVDFMSNLNDSQGKNSKERGSTSKNTRSNQGGGAFGGNKDSDSSGSQGPKQRLFSGSTYDEDDDHELRNLPQQASAIRTGAISVASGFALSECILYLFFSGGATDYERSLMLLRAIFPIHALSGALQSVNIVRRFVEGKYMEEGRTIGVGWTVLPAILLHGAFDVILASVNAYIDAAWYGYYLQGGVDDDEYWEAPYQPRLLNFITWSTTAVVMAFGLGWYLHANRQQTQRLLKLACSIDSGSQKGYFDAPSFEVQGLA
ncbi:hypothetical protein ACHAWF_016464 [Thalassiosira exigua]